MTSPDLIYKLKNMLLILLIAAFTGGMFIEKTYAPRLIIKDSHFGLSYSVNGVKAFKKFI
jgi:hypothetical protein